MKKTAAILLAGVMIFSLAACGDSEKDASESVSSPAEVSAESGAKNQKNSSVSEEEQVLELVEAQVLKDYENDETTVDVKSGQILDQNDTAYIVGFDISDTTYGNYMYTEAYWFNKETKEIKDVCSLTDYFDGMIDVTKGESNF